MAFSTSVLINLAAALVLVAMVQTAATELNQRNLAANCTAPVFKVKRLVRLMGKGYAQRIQAFTPLSLCQRAKDNDDRSRSDAQSTYAQELRRHNAFGNRNLESIPGCAAYDLQESVFNLPLAAGQCQWTMRCQFDENRFPQLLYEARMTDEGSLGQITCNCFPITRNVVVLRLVPYKGCPTWRKMLLTATIAYNCNRENEQHTPWQNHEKLGAP